MEAEKIIKMADVFTSLFVNLNIEKKDIKFLEILLGFQFSAIRVMKAIEKFGILNKENISNILASLDKAAGQSVEENVKLLTMLKEVKSESKD